MGKAIIKPQSNKTFDVKKFFVENKYVFYMIIIMLFGIIVRIYEFGALPAGLNQDEAYAGYDAERKAIRKEVRQEMEMNTIEVNRYINAAKNRRAAYQRRHKKD